MATESFLRRRRQKLLPTHLQTYPWLMADGMDAYAGYCSYCNCHLSVKRCDLSKHERTMKHKENEVIKMACDEFYRTTPEESSARVQQKDPTHELNQYLKFNVGANNNTTKGSNENGNNCIIESEELNFTPPQLRSEDNEEAVTPILVNVDVKDVNNDVPWYPCDKPKAARTIFPPNKLEDTEPAQIIPSPTKFAAGRQLYVKMPMKDKPAAQTPHVSTQVPLLKRPYNNISVDTAAKNLGTASPSPPKRAVPSDDSLVLFFNSICASVQGLPPKLAIEGKKRVMEIVADLELRAINERKHPTGQSDAE